MSSDLTNTPLAVNYRKAKGFSNFNSRKVVFYTVYFVPQTMTFMDDYENSTPNNEFARILQTIAFAGVELFFIGTPTVGGPVSGPGGAQFIIGVNSDTSNLGDVEESPGIFIATILTNVLGHSGWTNFVVRNVVDHDSIHSPFIGG